MQIATADLEPREAYRLMTACLIPRPIAWVATIDDAGRPNLAPFSYFGGVTSWPPTVMVSVGRRRGEQKDTAANLTATREGVIHIAHRPLAEAMVATSADLPAGDDEFTFAGLTAIPSVDVRPPRVAEAAVAMEARVSEHLEIGAGPVDMFLLEIVRFHLADEFLVDGRPDPTRLAAVGRLGGTAYCDTAAAFDVERPSA